MEPEPPSQAPLGSPWFCLRTQQKREHIAAGCVRKIAGVEVYCPRIRFEKMTRRGKVWFTEALFPGYVFARFDLEEHQKTVACSLGVTGIVRFGLSPTVVPNAAIHELRLLIADGEHEIVSPEVRDGDSVVLTSGVFQGLRTLVTQVLPAGERIRILMDFLGEYREVEIYKKDVLLERAHILAA